MKAKNCPTFFFSQQPFNKRLAKKQGNFPQGFSFLKRKGFAQVAIEHLTVTAAILAMVTIAFAFGFVTFDQNIKIAKARDALTALTSTANEIYTLGRGNVRFVDVSFPAGMKDMTIKHACCRNPNNNPCTIKEIVDTENSCANPTLPLPPSWEEHGEVEFSFIEITVSLLGGDTVISRESKAKLVLANFPPENEAAGGPPYPIRVSWTDDGEKIKLQRV